MTSSEVYEIGDEITDHSGYRFGRWIVDGLSRVVESGGKQYDKWHCTCDCGTYREVDGVNLRRGRSQSCGCSRRR